MTKAWSPAREWAERKAHREAIEGEYIAAAIELAQLDHNSRMGVHEVSGSQRRLAEARFEAAIIARDE